MSAQLYVASERPDLWERAYDQIVGVWPTYNEQGDVLGTHWSRLDKDFADFQLVLYDEEADLALATPVTLAAWQARPWHEKLIEHAASLLGSQL